ncbi:MAG: type II 3-dehydroquinate dehydratase [Enterobacteriaceae bacterium]
MKKKILILDGPNINLLKYRDKSKYGGINLKKIIKNLKIFSYEIGISLYYYQSNSECKLINKIQNSRKLIDFIIINPASFTHTSIAIRDALITVRIPFIEIHISNLNNQENFRKKSYFSDISNGVIYGFGTDCYSIALCAAIKMLIKNKKKGKYYI